jgi:hypothetical protein
VTIAMENILVIINLFCCQPTARSLTQQHDERDAGGSVWMTRRRLGLSSLFGRTSAPIVPPDHAGSEEGRVRSTRQRHFPVLRGSSSGWVNVVPVGPIAVHSAIGATNVAFFGTISTGRRTLLIR